LTERLARASAQHAKRVVAVWLLAALVASVLIVLLLAGGLTTEQRMTNVPESYAAAHLLAKRLPDPNPVDETIVVRSERLTADDPRFRRFVNDVAQKATVAARTGVTHAFAAVSRDRHAALITLDMYDGERRIGDVVRVVEAANSREDFAVHITGEWSIGHDFLELSQTDLREGELRYGLPASLVVLLIVFGTLIAAAVPLMLGVTTIVVALGLASLVAATFELSIFAVNMLTAVGLSLGIDYSLFVLSRYREERAHGLARDAAIARAGATASRAVLFSGTVFVVALTGLLLVPDNIMRSLAVGAITAGAVSVVAALTLLPAVLSLLGDRVNKLRVPVVGAAALSPEREGRFWGRAARGVMRHPVASLVATVTLMLAAATPVVGLKTGWSSANTFPDRMESKQGLAALDRDFRGGLIAPVRVVVVGDLQSRAVARAIEHLRRELSVSRLRKGDGIAEISTALPGVATEKRSTDTVRELRHRVRDLFAGTGARVYVAGTTAEFVDWFDAMDRWLPRVIAFVLALSFVLLTVAFRSIVVALKSIVLNLLSVGAAYGLLVLVFVKGVGAGLLGVQQVDSLVAWVPVLLFCVLFALSMDYHVFLLSRIRERYAQTGDNTEAVVHGIGTTARMITGAALIIITVFLGFAAGELVMFQQMGFGVGVALLLDATIVRSVLVPAAMKLLGRWNWWLPRWLEWLPDVRIESR
jgi:RND superfamily putative drug exporter